MARRWLVLCTGSALSAGAAASAFGCQWIVGLDDIELAASDASGEASDAATACEASTCPGPCIDFGTDPKNCGACGHDCLGGACKAGACQPVVLASKQPWPVAMALSSTEVFWADRTNPGAIMRCEKAGCASKPTQLASPTNPHSIAADDKNVYWAADDGTVALCAADGGACGPLVTGQNNVYGMVGLALDSVNVYWTVSDGTHGDVYRCKIDGSGCGQVSYPPTNGSALFLTVDPAGAYWTTAYGAVRKCPIAGCPAIGATDPVASGQTSPLVITHDAARLYWTNFPADGGGALVACDKASLPCTPNNLVVTDRPFGLAVDGTDAYFTRPFDGSVWKCALSGCISGPTQIAAAQLGPTAIAVDAKAVYWTNVGTGQADGTIMKLAK